MTVMVTVMVMGGRWWLIRDGWYQSKLRHVFVVESYNNNNSKD